MWEVVLDGKPLSGSFETKQAADNSLKAAETNYPGRKLEVLERQDGPDGSRYAGRDANGLPVTSVPLDAQKAIQAGAQPSGSAQIPSQGMQAGPGGAVQTEQVSTAGATPMVEGKNPSQAPKK